MRIYTRTGDDGTTGLFHGGRVQKNHLRVEAYGTVDELNACLGVVRVHQPPNEVDTWLTRIQNELFDLGADLATPQVTEQDKTTRISSDLVKQLEDEMDWMTEQLPALKHFILPGGTATAANLHLARTVCRRAERAVVTLAQEEPIDTVLLEYLNRLSDWLFMLSRYVNHVAGVNETKWEARNKG